MVVHRLLNPKPEGFTSRVLRVPRCWQPVKHTAHAIKVYRRVQCVSHLNDRDFTFELVLKFVTGLKWIMSQFQNTDFRWNQGSVAGHHAKWWIIEVIFWCLHTMLYIRQRQIWNNAMQIWVWHATHQCLHVCTHGEQMPGKGICVCLVVPVCLLYNAAQNMLEDVCRNEPARCFSFKRTAAVLALSVHLESPWPSVEDATACFPCASHRRALAKCFARNQPTTWSLASIDSGSILCVVLQTQKCVVRALPKFVTLAYLAREMQAERARVWLNGLALSQLCDKQVETEICEHSPIYEIAIYFSRRWVDGLPCPRIRTQVYGTVQSAFLRAWVNCTISLPPFHDLLI